MDSWLESFIEFDFSKGSINQSFKIFEEKYTFRERTFDRSWIRFVGMTVHVFSHISVSFPPQKSFGSADYRFLSILVGCFITLKTVSSLDILGEMLKF